MKIKQFQPEGCYKISLDLISFSIGDIITCELDNVEMINDGGDENTLNIVGEIVDYIRSTPHIVELRIKSE